VSIAITIRLCHQLEHCLDALQVLDVSQVGRARAADGTVQLFAHSEKDRPAAEVRAALAAAADATPGVTLRAAGALTPGLPPSSGLAFQRVLSTAQVVALAEFDESFVNLDYQGLGDSGEKFLDYTKKSFLRFFFFLSFFFFISSPFFLPRLRRRGHHHCGCHCCYRCHRRPCAPSTCLRRCCGASAAP
jgi:hypothetical protein